MRGNGYFIGMLLASIVVLAIGLAVAFTDWQATADWSERGSRGDYWGGHIAAAGSLASFLLLLLTVIMQRGELSLQRAELRATREEMERARQVHEAQERQLSRQASIAEASAVRNEILALYESSEQLRSRFRERFTRHRGAYKQGSGDEADGRHLRKQVAMIARRLSALLGAEYFDDNERAMLVGLFELPFHWESELLFQFTKPDGFDVPTPSFYEYATEDIG